jgi:hypothetical protein
VHRLFSGACTQGRAGPLPLCARTAAASSSRYTCSPVHPTLPAHLAVVYVLTASSDPDCSERFVDELLVLLSAKYFMATQEILQKGDISRELIFLIDGALESLVDGGAGGGTDGGGAAEVISSDVPDHCPCVGEVAFFLGIMQPWSVRAHKRSDVRVAALAREDGEALFRKFPDQRELICRNVLRTFDLFADGSFISTGEDDEADREPHYARVGALSQRTGCSTNKVV